MPLNLVLDPWIPVLRQAGPDVIRPDQMAESDVLRTDWPRPDLNLACLELLIGLHYLADPPRDLSDWLSRAPEPARLREALAPLAPAFEMTGEGPLFLQDLEPLTGEALPPDMLFIDSAGENAGAKNADLMVRRGRYPGLPLPLAAMALFTLQAHAPAGGAGNRTSMRGGGPMVTLVRPAAAAAPLWAAVWANVPVGIPLAPEDLDVLPWMRTTVTSEGGRAVPQPEGDVPDPETFFGMPRRLRLLTDGETVTGVVQKPWGTNYAPWAHPLTPFYAPKAGETPLPRHPRPGRFGYRHWLGVLLARAPEAGSLSFRARTVERFVEWRGAERPRVLVAGWAMSNATPLDFIWSEAPLFPLTPGAGDAAASLVDAADHAARALAGAVRAALGLAKAEATAAEAAREAFFAATEAAFIRSLDRLSRGEATGAVAADWLAPVQREALGRFDALALPGLAARDLVPRDAGGFEGKVTVATIVAARRGLLGALHGPKIHDLLGLPRPERPKTEEHA